MPLPGGWDSTRLDPITIVLSSLDRHAAMPGSVGGEVWSTTSHTAGKKYVEVAFSNSTPDGHVGVLDATEQNGVVLKANGTVEIYVGGVVTYSHLTFAPLAVNDVVGIAFNGDDLGVMFRVNGGPWNNDASVVDPPSGVVPRPYGLDYVVPDYGDPYNYLTDVPPDALLWSTGNAGGPFPNTEAGMSAALTAARTAGKALHFNVAQQYVGLFQSYRLPEGLYGKPGVILKYSGSVGSGLSVPCFGYLTDRDCVVKGIEFRSFGTVFGSSTRSTAVARGFAAAWDIHGSRRSAYGSPRCIDAGTFSGAIGVPTDYTVYPDSAAAPNVVPTVVGPSIWISDCTFKDCESAFLAWSDWIINGRVDFHRNILDGTWGGVALEGTSWSELHAVNNLWKDCIGTRQVPAFPKSSRFSSCFQASVNSGIDLEARKQVVRILNNEARNIEATVNSDGTNAGVFSDIRNATPTTITNGTDPFKYWCSIEVSFNKVVHVVGVDATNAPLSGGQEDSNAFYFKSRGHLLEGNYVEDCGSYWRSDTKAHNGPEASGLEFKQPGSGPQMANSHPDAKLVHRGNEYVNMPPKRAKEIHDPITNKVTVPAVAGVCGSNDCMLPVYYIGDIHRNTHIIDTTGSSPTLIRHYGDARSFSVMCCSFYNCSTQGSGTLATSPGGLIGLHEITNLTGSLSEFSNNVAYSGANVTYTTNTPLIKQTGQSSGIGSAKVGRNSVATATGTIVGNMTAPFGGGTVPIRIYERPTVEV